MATRTPVIGGNWKMNLTLPEALHLAGELRNRLGSQRGVEVILFPPFPFLETVGRRIEGTQLHLGGQDLYWETHGAYTGGVSGPMLRTVGCTHVLVGHSERRTVFGDGDQAVGKKLRAALSAGLDPVLCVGESLDERKAGDTFRVVARQLDTALAGLSAQQLSKLIVAYEPVWAIGTGLVATPEQAQEVHAFLRQRLADLYDRSFADAVRLQYGGSVKAATAAGLLAQPDIDGLLVGGASLQAEEFTNICRAQSRKP